MDVYVRLHGTGSGIVHRRIFLGGLFHFVPVKCLHLSVVHSRRGQPYSCGIASKGDLIIGFFNDSVGRCVKYPTSGVRPSCISGLRLLMNMVRNGACGRKSSCITGANVCAR